MKDTNAVISALQLLGLTPKEATVYLASLERGSATTLEIAREAKIPRSTVYSVVESLVRKNLLMKIPHTREVRCVAQDPKILLERSRTTYESIKNAVPQLSELFDSSGYKPKIKYYEGLEQIQNLYWDILRIPRLKQYDILTSTPHFFHLGKPFVYEFMKKRATQGIRTRIIASESAEIKKLKSSETEYLFQLKVVPGKLFPHLSSFIHILPKQVIFVGMEAKFAVAIESREIREPLQVMFNIIWNSQLEIHV